MDVGKQLHEYEVEYHVLQEEMSSPRPEEMEALRKLEATNRALIQQTQLLEDQLQVSIHYIYLYCLFYRVSNFLLTDKMLI